MCLGKVLEQDKKLTANKAPAISESCIKLGPKKVRFSLGSTCFTTRARACTERPAIKTESYFCSTIVPLWWCNPKDPWFQSQLMQFESQDLPQGTETCPRPVRVPVCLAACEQKGLLLLLPYRAIVWSIFRHNPWLHSNCRKHATTKTQFN